MHAPTSQLVSFFQSVPHTVATHRVVTLDAARTRATSLLQEASDRLHNAKTGVSDMTAKLHLTDDVASLCVGALAAAHGLLLQESTDVFKSSSALTALVAELELSEESSEPLYAVRDRTGGHVQITDADAFLAHQGAFLSTGLLDWTTDRVSAVLAH